uniref:Uncharacterized protein n=1 Tax=Rhizophora mucronata TaxID=61149 RepID=A0A2P2ITB8_RHIMU
MDVFDSLLLSLLQLLSKYNTKSVTYCVYPSSNLSCLC